MGLFGKYFEKISKPSGRSSIFYSHRLVTFAGPSKLRYLSKVYSKMMEAALSFGGDIYLSDGIFAWGRVIGWIRDKKLLESIAIADPSDQNGGVDSAIAWRTHVACWASSQACKAKGDFFEFGCYEGYTGAAIRSFLGNDFKKVDKRNYFWLDMFAAGKGGNQKTLTLDQSKSEIKALARAENFDDVLVVQGNVLSTYIEDHKLSSRKIAFAHFDLNDFETEMKILEKAVQNTSSGSVFLFDDFAMLPFREQNKKYRNFFREKGLEILELPTGQGLVIF